LPNHAGFKPFALEQYHLLRFEAGECVTR